MESSFAHEINFVNKEGKKMPLTCICKILISNQLNKKTHRHIYRGKVNASCLCLWVMWYLIKSG